MIRKYMVGLVVFGIFNINGIAIETNTTQESNQTEPLKSVLIVDLDRERTEQKSRGEISDIITGTLALGDNNDEVSFVGKMLVDASNIVITIKDNSGKIKKIIKDSLTIDTSEINDGDIVTLQKDKKVLMKKEVVK